MTELFKGLGLIFTMKYSKTLGQARDGTKHHQSVLSLSPTPNLKLKNKYDPDEKINHQKVPPNPANNGSISVDLNMLWEPLCNPRHDRICAFTLSKY